MPSMEDMRNALKRITRNKSFSDEDLLTMMNNAVRSVAGGLMFKHPDGTQALSPPLPDLVAAGTLTTSTTLPYISLPADYQRNLYMLHSTTQQLRVHNLYPTYAEFLTNYPAAGVSNLTCSVIAAAVRGSYLWYQGVPTTAETLVAHYYRLPTAITETTITSTPEGIPEHLQEDIILSYCARRIFKEIEAGVGAQLVNTAKYESLLNEALSNLDMFYPTHRESLVFAPDNDQSYWRQ